MIEILKNVLKDCNIENLTFYELKSLHYSLKLFESEFQDKIKEIEDKMQEKQPKIYTEVPKRVEFEPKLSAKELQILSQKNLLLTKDFEENLRLNRTKNTPKTHELKKTLLENKHQDPAEDEENMQFLILEKAELLKRKTNEFSSLLAQDSKDLNNLENIIEHSHTSLKNRRSEIHKVSATTWKTTIWIWLSVLVAVFAFLYMFLFMKIFSVKR